MADDVILSVEDLSIDFNLRTHILHAARNVSFDLRRGKTLCLVGESGSGKSVTARTLLRIIDKNGSITPVASCCAARLAKPISSSRRAQPRASQYPRRPHRADLPGTDELAVAGPYHRQPDRRGAAPSPAMDKRQARAATIELFARSRSPTPKPRSTATPSSSPAACGSGR